MTSVTTVTDRVHSVSIGIPCRICCEMGLLKTEPSARAGQSATRARRRSRSCRARVLDAAPKDDAQHQRTPAVARGHGAHVSAAVGRRDAEDLVPGDRATDVEHDNALAAVAEAAHRRRPAVLPVAAGHAVLVLEARVPVVSLAPAGARHASAAKAQVWSLRPMAPM